MIPYYANPADLPSELPAKHEVHGSKDVLCEQSARKIVGVGEHFIVKYGLQVDLEEGRTMAFVKNKTSAAVPTVYALFHDPESSENYIVMERIHGVRLDILWPSMDDAQKRLVALQMKDTMTQLRKLPSPEVDREGRGYCSLGGKPLRDHIFYTGFEDQSFGIEGTFHMEEELNDALIKKYLASGFLPTGKADFYRRSFPNILVDHPPTFTHGDLQRKNMIVDPESLALTLIDWEFAGWYPSYWEYSRAIFSCGHFEDDWSEWIDFVLKPYRNEWAWMQMLMLELWS